MLRTPRRPQIAFVHEAIRADSALGVLGATAITCSNNPLASATLPTFHRMTPRWPSRPGFCGAASDRRQFRGSYRPRQPPRASVVRSRRWQNCCTRRRWASAQSTFCRPLPLLSNSFSPRVRHSDVVVAVGALRVRLQRVHELGAGRVKIARGTNATPSSKILLHAHPRHAAEHEVGGIRPPRMLTFPLRLTPSFVTVNVHVPGGGADLGVFAILVGLFRTSAPTARLPMVTTAPRPARAL